MLLLLPLLPLLLLLLLRHATTRRYRVGAQEHLLLLRPTNLREVRSARDGHKAVQNMLHQRMRCNECVEQHPYAWL